MFIQRCWSSFSEPDQGLSSEDIVKFLTNDSRVDSLSDIDMQMEDSSVTPKTTPEQDDYDNSSEPAM